MRKFWDSIHPKIKGVVIVGLVGTVVQVLNAIADVYPNAWWTGIVLAAAMAFTGYQVPSTKAGK